MTFNPSGWNSPAAIRRQVRPCAGRSRPPTIQTSPSQVQTAALLPSGRKSKPEGRTWQSQGLLSGSVRTSTANGPSSRPMTGCVLRTSGHRFGPPWVKELGGSGAGEPAAYASSALGPPPDISTLRTRDDPDGGTFSTIDPSRRDRLAPARSPARLTETFGEATRIVSSTVEGPISRVRVKIATPGCAGSVSRPGISRTSVAPTV